MFDNGKQRDNSLRLFVGDPSPVSSNDDVVHHRIPLRLGVICLHLKSFPRRRCLACIDVQWLTITARRTSLVSCHLIALALDLVHAVQQRRVAATLCLFRDD